MRSTPFGNMLRLEQLTTLIELIGELSEDFADPMGELYQQDISSGHNGQYWDT